MEPWHYLLLFGVGAVAGTLNVIAGGGSFLSLPILIFLGLPAVVANGTNRVAILLQNVFASWGFHRHGVLDLRAILWAAVPATLGAGLGTGLALIVDDRTFTRLLAWIMVAVSLWTLRPQRKVDADAQALHPGLLAIGFFFVGIYGGFVQAGVGFLVLAATSMARLDLVRGNAVKVLSILCFTALSLAIFASQGKVQWVPGLALAFGNVLGGLVGVRVTVKKGHEWIRRAVTVVIVIFAIRLWFGS